MMASSGATCDVRWVLPGGDRANSAFTETIAESGPLARPREAGYAMPYGPDTVTGNLDAERRDLGFRDAHRMLANGIEAESRCAALPALCLTGNDHRSLEPTLQGAAATGRACD